MSTLESPWTPAIVADPEAAPAVVRFGAAAGNEISMSIAQAIIALWHDRAAANVGTALADPDVFLLLLPLLTPEACELILTAWYQKQPALFGAYLAEAFTGIRPARTRTKARP